MPAPAAFKSAMEVRVLARIQYGVDAQVNSGSYFVVPAAWLRDNMDLFVTYMKAQLPAYVAGSNDCKHFSAAAKLALNRAAALAGIEASPLVATIYVQQRATWAGVPAGGKHALNGIVTDEGIFVFEPQGFRSGHPQWVHEDAYPNRETLYWIDFDD